MLNLKKTLVGAIVAAVAAGGFAGSAQAQLTNPSTLGALAAVPYFTTPSVVDGGERITVVTATNNGQFAGAFANRNLHVYFINGDTWDILDRDCIVTPFETTYFVFESSGSGAKVTYECQDPFTNEQEIVTAFPNGRDGIMVVTHENPTQPGAPLNPNVGTQNILLVDATVLDFGQGAAWSVLGIHYQGVADSGSADRNFLFNGAAGELLQNPGTLVSNFLAPDDGISVELILFSLDGTAGTPPIGRLFGFAFDDDENSTSAFIDVDCLTVIEIDDPTAFGVGMNRANNDYLVGHVTLAPVVVSRLGDIHDLTAPTTVPILQAILSPGFRRTSVHGWIMQTIASGGDLSDGDLPMSGATMSAEGQWARQLVQGTDTLVPSLGDHDGFRPQG